MIEKTIGTGLRNFSDKFSELKQRILFLICALIVFRIGSYIPIPGIDTIALESLLEQHRGTILEMFNMFSGGALSRASIFALGIMPFISASIIIQILTLTHTKFIEMKKEGEQGRYKINKYIRYVTLVLAFFQSLGMSISFPNISGLKNLIINPSMSFYFLAVISLVTGTMFLMWLGELITEKGIGNGISIIIFSGIISGLPLSFMHSIEQIRQGNLNILLFFFIGILIFSITFFVVFIERCQRKITINYSRRHLAKRSSYVASDTYLPLKLNMAGVIPAIFASSIILFPVTIVSWFGNVSYLKWLVIVSYYLQPAQPLYILIYIVSIIFFCFFYTGLAFNPRETSENLKKSGAFIFGIRPGEQTAKYIKRIMFRLTSIGSVYMTFICLVPECLRVITGVPFYFGGTSLLIVVVVIIDFVSQLQTCIISTQYASVLKKNKFKF